MAKYDETNLKDAKTIAALYSGVVGLTLFWVLVVMKKAYSGVKSVLNFYPDVGALLGAFTYGLIGFVLTYFIVSKIMKDRNKNELSLHERKASVLFLVSVVLVFFMTFPPIYESVAKIIS